VEPLLGDIMQYYQKCLSAGVDASLDLGKNMNHDYQFFFAAVPMNDPELPRYWSVVRAWVHRLLEQEIKTQ
jgi:hypothetical protein